MMDDFNTDTDSDYTSYWRDWVSYHFFPFSGILDVLPSCVALGREMEGVMRARVGQLPCRQPRLGL